MWLLDITPLRQRVDSGHFLGVASSLGQMSRLAPDLVPAATAAAYIAHSPSAHRKKALHQLIDSTAVQKPLQDATILSRWRIKRAASEEAVRDIAPQPQTLSALIHGITQWKHDYLRPSIDCVMIAGGLAPLILGLEAQWNGYTPSDHSQAMEAHQNLSKKLATHDVDIEAPIFMTSEAEKQSKEKGSEIGLEIAKAIRISQLLKKDFDSAVHFKHMHHPLLWTDFLLRRNARYVSDGPCFPGTSSFVSLSLQEGTETKVLFQTMHVHALLPGCGLVIDPYPSTLFSALGEWQEQAALKVMADPTSPASLVTSCLNNLAIHCLNMRGEGPSHEMRKYLTAAAYNLDPDTITTLLPHMADVSAKTQIALLVRALEINPEHPHVLVVKALWLVTHGRAKEAVNTLKRFWQVWIQFKNFQKKSEALSTFEFPQKYENLLNKIIKILIESGHALDVYEIAAIALTSPDPRDKAWGLSIVI